ncbi:MAG: FAD-dependent monooxygenase [Vitreoscilla sp.]
MNNDSPFIADVLVAGAGPVGLLLACELALAGIRVLVLEREVDPASALKAPPLGTRGVSVASAEALDRRGLLDALLAAVEAAQPAGASASRKTQAGHFAGIPIDASLIDPTDWPWRLPGALATNIAADMRAVEAVLAARAAALGVEIRRGRTVDAVHDDGDGVTVRAGGEDFAARWLVGADGGRSSVRRLAGFDFPGTEPEFTAYLAVVDIADPDKLPPGRNVTATGMVFNQPGQIAIADFDGGAFDRSQVITREHLQAVLRRVSGTDVTLRAVHQATTFTDRARQASAYRRGRVLLAGDAAHVHSALGGQGLNVGLGDAMNLGWKLAATVRGTAPAALLDTYHAERHSVGQWVLDWTRAQVDLMRPGPHARAIERVVRALAGTRDGATWLAGQLWGVAARCELGEPHPLAGRGASDFAFDDGTRLAARMRDGRGVLVDFDPAAPLRTLAAGWRDRVHHVAATARDTLGLSALLVRPDGIVAWACDDVPDAADAAHALARWFGAPVAA